MSTFEKETSELEKESSPQPLLLSIGAEILPNWFWDIPTSNSQEIYAIGISDPQIESQQKAKLQAIERAKMQIALISGTKVSGITDYYVEASGEKNKLEESYIYECKPVLLGSISIIDSFETRFGEKIILLKFQNNLKDSIPVQVNIKKYLSSTRADIGWYTTELTCVNFQCDTLNLNYKFMQSDNSFSALSNINKDTIKIPLGIYDYKPPIKSSDSIQNSKSVKLEHKGLWFGYIESFINNMSILAFNQRASTKSVNEVENKEKNDEEKEIATNLTRSILKNEIHFSINKIDTQDGNLNVLLK